MSRAEAGAEVRMGIESILRANGMSSRRAARLAEEILARLPDGEAPVGPSDGHQELLQHIIHTTTDGFCLTDTGHRIVEANGHLARLLGYAHHELLGRSFPELDAGRQPDTLHERMERVQRTGSETFQARLRRADGTALDVEVSASYLAWRGGRIICFCRDISQKKMRLKRSLMLADMLDRAPCGIIVHGLNGRVLYANRRSLEMFGCTYRQLLGMGVSGPDTLGYAQAVGERMDAIREQGEVSFEVALPGRQGMSPTLWVFARAVDWLGEPAVLCIATDVSETKRMRESLQEQNRLLTTLLDNLQVGVYMVEAPSGRPLLANRKAAEILGPGILPDAQADPLEAPYRAFIRGTDRLYPTDQMPLVKGMFGESHHAEDMEMERPDGARVPLEVFGVPVRDAQGNIIASLVNLIDISERASAQETLAQERVVLRTLIDSIPDAIYVKDRECRKLIANRADCQNLGLEREEQLLGKDDFDVYPPEIAQPFYEDDMRVIELGEHVVNREERLVRPDGQTLWLLTTKLPVYNAKGQIVGLVGVGRDITDRKRALDALRDSQQLIENILNTVPVRVFWKDLALNYLGCNLPFARDAGRQAPHEVVGANDYQMGWREEADLYRADDRRVIETGVPRIGYEEPQSTPPGEQRWLRTSKVPLRNAQGQIIGVLGTYEDITPYKQAEAKLREQNEEYLALNEELIESNRRILSINAELERARERAEESDRLKTAFLANMSHEIRTPMNSIIGFSEILLRPNLAPDRQLYFTQLINAACHQLLSVINDVIDIARIETNQVTLFESELNINSSIRSIHAIFLPEAASRGIDMALQLGLPDPQATIRADEAKFSQIITNLLGNAIKFTEQGQIVVGYTPKADLLEFFVRDTGIGISPAHHELIFNRFRQVDSSDSRKYGGAGLGLAIARAFVELFGGRIWVESQLGQGATFYFTLPYQPLGGPPERQAQVAEEAFDFRGKRILVAEDEQANYLLVKEFLDGTRAQLLHASDGAEALELFERNPGVNLILMDIKMPRVNGIEATRVLRARRAQVPIVAITAYAMSGDREQCLEAGCTDYITKPLIRLELLRLIRALLAD